MKNYFTRDIYLFSFFFCMIIFCMQSEGFAMRSNEGDTLTLSQQYPNDVGLENDTNVLFIEKLEGTLSEIQGKYSDVKNPQDMTLQPDVPFASHSPYSIRISNRGGTTEGGHLFKRLNTGLEGTVYLRYYVKYPLISKGYFHHIGIRMGGYDPPTNYPIGQAGVCGNQTRFSNAYEPVTPTGKMETYNYWHLMHGSGGQCYGNSLITNNGKQKYLEFDKWMCVEMMIKLNDPGKFNGEFRVWQNGEEIGYWKEGAPMGRWNGGAFLYSGEPLVPFEGFMWRSADHPNLNVNYIKFEFYDTKSPPTKHENYVQYANVVMAKKRIGPLVDKEGTSSSMDNSLTSFGATIYPNPASSMLTITGRNEGADRTKVEIFNVFGSKIYSSPKAMNFPDQIDISSFEKGIYFVKVSDSRNSCIKKIVKE